MLTILVTKLKISKNILIPALPLKAFHSICFSLKPLKLVGSDIAKIKKVHAMKKFAANKHFSNIVQSWK